MTAYDLVEYARRYGTAEHRADDALVVRVQEPRGSWYITGLDRRVRLASSQAAAEALVTAALSRAT